MRTRVVVTGMGAVSPYGEGVQALVNGVEQGKHALTNFMQGAALTDKAYDIGGSAVSVAGMVPKLQEKRIARELRRSMSPMSIYATLAAWEALEQAGLGVEATHTDFTQKRPRMGLALGSTLGSTQALHDFFAIFLQEKSVENVRSTAFFKVMSHSAASNVALACHVRGRVLAPSAACASGLLAMGLAYESILAGQEQSMLCGGSDEYHPLTSATFDRLGAASHATNTEEASLPFDVRRSGVVCSEGAGVLYLESLESALARKATIYGEILGFATVQSANIAQPDVDTMQLCMEEALHSAKLRAQDIAYVNAHATATLQGDAAEAEAIMRVFGHHVPVNSFKGHMGHTMAACGALESIASLALLQKSLYAPTLGLTKLDPLLPALNYVRSFASLQADAQGKTKPLLKNCFALGGCVCSLVMDRFYNI